MPTDTELFHEIVRATLGVDSANVSKALARIREILKQSEAAAEPPEERVSRTGRDRLEHGGRDRKR